MTNKIKLYSLICAKDQNYVSNQLQNNNVNNNKIVFLKVFKSKHHKLLIIINYYNYIIFEKINNFVQMMRWVCY